MNIGFAIKKLRSSKKFTQKVFAEMVGVSQTYLCQIEKGSRNPTIKVLQSIASGLCTSLPIMLWFSVEEVDIEDSKKEAYKILKPTIDTMIESII